MKSQMDEITPDNSTPSVNIPDTNDTDSPHLPLPDPSIADSPQLPDSNVTDIDDPHLSADNTNLKKLPPVEPYKGGVVSSTDEKSETKNVYETISLAKAVKKKGQLSCLSSEVSRHLRTGCHNNCVIYHCFRDSVLDRYNSQFECQV